MCPEGKDTPPSAAYILSIFNIEQIEKSRTKVTARHAHIVAGFFSSHHMVTSCFKRVSPIWNPPWVAFRRFLWSCQRPLFFHRPLAWTFPAPCSLNRSPRKGDFRRWQFPLGRCYFRPKPLASSSPLRRCFCSAEPRASWRWQKLLPQHGASHS